MDSDEVAGPTRIVRISATRVSQVITQRTNPPVYGDGDGYGPSGPSVTPLRALLAADGSLLVCEDRELPSPEGGQNRLRAIVPPASPRLRLALRPSFWQGFAGSTLSIRGARRTLARHLEHATRCPRSSETTNKTGTVGWDRT